MPEIYKREGFNTITPYIMVKDANGLIDFVKEVFGARVTYQSVGAAGGIHTELKIGDSMLMVGGINQGEEVNAALYIYVENVDITYDKALEAGATSTFEPVIRDFGERMGGVKDKFGNIWFISTPIQTGSA